MDMAISLGAEAKDTSFNKQELPEDGDAKYDMEEDVGRSKP